MNGTIESVHGWLGELKSIVNFEDEAQSDQQTAYGSHAGGKSVSQVSFKSAPSEPVSSGEEGGGFLNTSIKKLEAILQDQGQDGSANRGPKS